MEDIYSILWIVIAGGSKSTRKKTRGGPTARPGATTRTDQSGAPRGEHPQRPNPPSPKERPRNGADRKTDSPRDRGMHPATGTAEDGNSNRRKFRSATRSHLRGNFTTQIRGVAHNLRPAAHIAVGRLPAAEEARPELPREYNIIYDSR